MKIIQNQTSLRHESSYASTILLGNRFSLRVTSTSSSRGSTRGLLASRAPTFSSRAKLWVNTIFSRPISRCEKLSVREVTNGYQHHAASLMSRAAMYSLNQKPRSNFVSNTSVHSVPPDLIKTTFPSIIIHTSYIILKRTWY